MADLLTLAAQLRTQRAQDDALRQQTAQQGGVAIGGMAPAGGSSGTTAMYPQYQQQQGSTSSPLSSIMDGATKYNQASHGGLNDLFSSSAGSSVGATGASYAGSGAEGTGFGLGGSLVSGGASGEGAGAGLGSALGSYGGGSSAAGGFGSLGSTTSGGLGGLLGGSGASGGSSLGAGAGGGGAGAGAGAGAGLGALAALSYLGDKEMNENKGSWINTDKLNNAGTIGGSGIGLRFGDFGNGFNPATWLSDPKKAGKGLVNAFTFGLADKVFDIF